MYQPPTEKRILTEEDDPVETVEQAIDQEQEKLEKSTNLANDLELAFENLSEVMKTIITDFQEEAKKETAKQEALNRVSNLEGCLVDLLDEILRRPDLQLRQSIEKLVAGLRTTRSDRYEDLNALYSHLRNCIS